MKQTLEVIPLGGVGEFGMNCAVLRYGSDLILIDAGMTFPGSAGAGDLGVDVIVPDISFLKEHAGQFRGIILTHGHEDHAGAVSYIVNELPVPVYGGRLTLGMVAARLKERNLLQAAQLQTISARHPFQVGPFEIEPLYVTHSFPESFCLAIKTPVGTLLWSGDFKFDPAPIDRRLSDVGRLAEYGEQGVLALFSDSTNSESRGFCPSEQNVVEPLRTLIGRARRKVVVSCFASSIHRMQVIFDLAGECGRRVFPLGRSMVNNIRTAIDLGFLRMPPERIAGAGELSALDEREILVLASGSQGEPMSALSRLAVNEVRNVKMEEEDIVILSARIIPGNEKLIANLVNHFYRRGARVFDTRSHQVHVSGHGFRDDLKMMINLTRPKYFVPIHGDVKQLRHHAWLAEDQGLERGCIQVLENGDVLSLDSDGMNVTGKVSVGRRFIDEGFAEEVHEVVLRDRRFLSEDGFLVVILRLDRSSGYQVGEAELISRGFVQMDTSDGLVESTRAEIAATVLQATLEEKQDEELFKEILRKNLKRFLRRQTGKRPMILPVMIET